MDRRWLNPLWPPPLPVCPPGPSQALSLELLDAMSGEFVQEHQSEAPGERANNLPIPRDAALVEFGVVAEVDSRKLAERDVWLASNPVAPFQDTRARA